MKISYISGIENRQTDTQEGPDSLIGNLDWADRVGYKMSRSDKLKYRANQIHPLISVARGIMRELISGNRGGMASMLWGMSPFNTKGQIDQGLKNKYDAFMRQARKEANDLYPLKRVTQGYVDALRRQGKAPAPQDPILGDLAFGQLPYAKDDNYKKHVALLRKMKKDANKKFPYLVIPPSNLQARQKYRRIEIQWLKMGGNVNTFNAAVKEGYKKSPRSKTFNYLLGKIAAKRYVAKDIGLAIRAVVSATFGGDRFKWTDKDIFNPWAKRFGTMKLDGGIGAEPASTAATTATVTASSKWWIALIKVLTPLILGALTIIYSNRDDEPTPQVVNGGGGDGNGGNFNAGGGFDVQSLLIPAGIAVGAYFLLSDDKK